MVLEAGNQPEVSPMRGKYRGREACHQASVGIQARGNGGETRMLAVKCLILDFKS